MVTGLSGSSEGGMHVCASARKGGSELHGARPCALYDAGSRTTHPRQASSPPSPRVWAAHRHVSYAPHRSLPAPPFRAPAAVAAAARSGCALRLGLAHARRHEEVEGAQGEAGRRQAAAALQRQVVQERVADVGNARGSHVAKSLTFPKPVQARRTKHHSRGLHTLYPMPHDLAHG